MHYGYIGLGNPAAACAGCLRRAGFAVTVHDRNPARAAALVAMSEGAWAQSSMIARLPEDLLGTDPRVRGFRARLEQVQLASQSPGMCEFDLITPLLGRECCPS